MTVHNKGALDIIIQKAIGALKKCELEQAVSYLHEAMTYDDKLACVHNLLGVVAEIKGDTDLACAYYRASSAFDSQYEPANKNLERITDFQYHFVLSRVSFEPMDIEPDITTDQNEYYIDYNQQGVGHIKKKG